MDLTKNEHREMTRCNLSKRMRQIDG